MADWTQLPSDLLHLISKRLHSPFDVVRLRYVCSTWRSAVTSHERHCLAPSLSVIPANDGSWSNSPGYFTLLKRRVLLIGSSKTNIQTEPSTSWIIKIQRVHGPNRIRFLKPLSKSHFGNSLPYNFPEGFNPLDLRVLVLGEEYVLSTSILGDDDTHVRKAAFSCSNSNVNDFVLLSISDHGNLAMFKSSDKKWTKIHQDTIFRHYHDVIFYKGNFYAVDSRGRTLVVGLDSETSTVVGAPAYRARKCLVESNGELLLVAKYTSSVVEMPSLAWRGKFRVFKLDEVGKKWIKVYNLGDRVLFLPLGNGCAFATSAENLSVRRGNYIVFINSIGDRDNICVFDLEDGFISPLSNFSQLYKLFSPPSS
ncbi:hypothetical protein PTKIN_Ptkin10aG0167700 [Pterospermum kingtungense]